MKNLRIASSLISAEALRCHICDGIIFEPIKCPDCRTIYCTLCLVKNKCNTSGCVSIGTIKKKPGKNWLNLYNQTIVNCLFESSGCKVKININEIYNHLENECKYSSCCSYCQQKIYKVEEKYGLKILEIEEECNSKMLKVEEECKIKITKLEEEYKLRVAEIEQKFNNMMFPRFDRNFSLEYFTFSENDSKAVWKKGSNTQLYRDYNEWPTVRIGILFEKEFQVQFIISSRVWFGIGTQKIKSDGFQGYTTDAYMISSNEGLYYNRARIDAKSIHISSGETITFKYNPNSLTIFIKISNGEVTYTGNFPKKVYFCVSLQNGSYVKLVSLKY